VNGRFAVETVNVVLDDAYVRDHSEVPTGAYVILVVSDTSVGMTERVREHIFESFFTTKAGAKHGLSIRIARSWKKIAIGALLLTLIVLFSLNGQVLLDHFDALLLVSAPQLLGFPSWLDTISWSPKRRNYHTGRRLSRSSLGLQAILKSPLPRRPPCMALARMQRWAPQWACFGVSVHGGQETGFFAPEELLGSGKALSSNTQYLRIWDPECRRKPACGLASALQRLFPSTDAISRSAKNPVSGLL